MTLQQLKYIIAVAQKGTISEAAKDLFISQPSLTNAIREAENELGFQIFHRTNRGISMTDEGMRFLSYARQVVEQMSLLEKTFFQQKKQKYHFQISAQHYSFVVDAFVAFIKEYQDQEYEVTLRECRTHEIIEDVKDGRSQLGILYLSRFNEHVMENVMHENHLDFHELFVSEPHVFICSSHPLAKNEYVTLEDLEEYPYLSYEQGKYNSFYFSEEILSTVEHKKSIRVSDRATLFNLLIGMDGYTICTGIISKELNGENIISKRLLVDEMIRIGYIHRNDVALSSTGIRYLELLKQYVDHINE